MNTSPEPSPKRRDTQWRRREEIAGIRESAAHYAALQFHDPVFVSGVALYWGEGSKTRNDLSMTNADPRILHGFVMFVRSHLDRDAQFTLALHLHDGDDEDEAKQFWKSGLALPNAKFTKSYYKPTGTGHRKKILPHGICRIRVRRASDHWHRVMQWIEELAHELAA